MRNFKYQFLIDNKLDDISFKILNPVKPYLFFVLKNADKMVIYNEGFSVCEMFSLYNSGIVTGIDKYSIFNSELELIDTTNNIVNSKNPFG